MTKESWGRTGMAAVLAAAGWSGVAHAQTQVQQLLDPMVMIGSKEEVYHLPGSGYYLGEEEIKNQNYFSVNRILAAVPGVYVREEDGFGNFPNISIRGGDGTRSEKVTIMEDGILSAPAPYSAPAAYYSPNASRMSGIEVLKGSSQVRFGPHTTGGAINYLSTPIPTEPSYYLRGTYGEYGTALGHAHYGDTLSGDFGRFGYLLELFRKQSDGYRKIDSGIGYAGSEDTGFTLTEPMVKLFWEPNSATPQRLEFKYGYSELDADETYVGLTEEDIRRDPSRRYAGTLFDNIQTKQHRTYLKYRVEPQDNIRLSATGYYNEFSRNWYKIRKADGQDLHKILAQPTSPVYANAFDVLRLQAPGVLDIRANQRDYKSYGIQFNGAVDFETGPLTHETRVGARLHTDENRRFQRDDQINVGAGAPVIVKGVPGSGGNRLEEADALSLWLEHDVKAGVLTLTPGVRYEYVKMAYTDYAADPSNTVTGKGRGDTSNVAPGLGAHVRLTERDALFGSIYKGISVPGPRSYVKDGVDWEESLGYELGYRHQRDKIYGELVGFYTRYDNLIGTSAGLGAGTSRNAGEAEVYGVEMLAQYDPFKNEPIQLPLFLSATWTQSELKDALATGGGENILAGGKPGAALPYVPEWKLAAGVGLKAARWGLDLAATYSSDTHGTVRELNAPDDSSRQGRIEGGVIVDVSGYFQIRKGFRLLSGLNNVFDKQLITSRIPEGPRSSAPRFAYVGLELY
jgi:Fe(3+) dicitrate transport protein